MKVSAAVQRKCGCGCREGSCRAAHIPGSPPRFPDNAWTLQRTIGNQALGRLLSAQPMVQRGGAWSGEAKKKGKPCVTGTFLSVPSGDLKPELHKSAEVADAWDFDRRFDILALFAPIAPRTDCIPGEYRQFAKGTLKVNFSAGRPTGSNVNSEELREDSVVRWERPDPKNADAKPVKKIYVYGHRSIPYWNSRYSKTKLGPEDNTGCHFWSADSPGITGTAAQWLKIDAEFKGQLIDTCIHDEKQITPHDNPLAESHWTVKGEVQVPTESTGPEAAPQTRKQDASGPPKDLKD